MWMAAERRTPPDPSLPASDVVLNGNNWTPIGLLRLRCSLSLGKHGISLLRLMPCTQVSLRAIVSLFLNIFFNLAFVKAVEDVLTSFSRGAKTFN